ncbi:hypothetical protein RchiOBHm_Chr6g0263131 [Rosa chinensis]|uniref:Uncharacterized protein n=1 Tax=Rosa chinensis TaxID=74649 RepID=A0A2P6PNU2_ROSCH|nr:hypothetical protein RchiOBHm_Chr6g0263131 [Rosa chinensis]
MLDGGGFVILHRSLSKSGWVQPWSTLQLSELQMIPEEMGVNNFTKAINLDAKSVWAPLVMASNISTTSVLLNVSSLRPDRVVIQSGDARDQI